MYELIGGLLGCAAGLCAWFGSRRLVARYRTQPAHPATAQAGRHFPRAASVASLRALLVLAAFSLLGGYLGWRAPGIGQITSILVVTALLVTLSLVDFQVRRIPNALVLALLLWTPVQMLWLGQPTLVEAGLGLLVGGGLFFLLALVGRGAMGAGDVKLAAALGTLLGFPLILPALLCGAIAGGIAALALLLARRVGRKDPIAYGPYIALGAWIIWIGSFGLWP